MNSKSENICGVILAGGKCSRYKGKNKAFLKINEITFYDKTKHLLKDLFEEIIIITNCIENFPDDKIPKHQDFVKEIGPLGGIHTALLNARNFDAVFIVAIDMPFLTAEIIHNIISVYNQKKSDILIPIIDGNLEPLTAIYSLNIFNKLNEYLKSTDNFSIRSFFKQVNTEFVELEATPSNKKAFCNINSQSEYDKYIGAAI